MQIIKTLFLSFFVFIYSYSVECPICLDNLEDHNTIELPCHCKFHEHCLTKQFSLQDKRLESETIYILNQDYDDEYYFEENSFQSVEITKPLINCKDCAVCGMYIGDAFDLYLKFYKAYKNKKFFECLELAKKLSETTFCEQARQKGLDYISQLFSTSSMPEDKRLEFLLHKFIKIDNFQDYITQCLIELRESELIKINKSTKNARNIFEERRMFLDFCESQLQGTVFKNSVIRISSI